MKIREIVESDSEHLLTLAIQSVDFKNIVDSYDKFRTYLSITGKKKNQFSEIEFQKRVKIIDEYQEKLDILRKMIINDPIEEDKLWPIQVKLWAIEKHNNFTNARKKLNI
jgi:hypothetical protein